MIRGRSADIVGLYIHVQSIGPVMSDETIPVVTDLI